MKNNYECLINLVLIIIILLIFTTNNKKVNDISKKMLNGKINTILIIIIITLILTENIKMGFYLTIIYLFLLIKNKNNNSKEYFDSDYGYSPLNCNTYSDSRKKNGSAYYPLNSMN